MNSTLSAPNFQKLPIDDIPVFCPTWEEIAGKAHHYQTARVRATGAYVKVCRVVRFVDGLETVEPLFACRHIGEASVTHYSTEELCAFCL
jgi:hypothetical protein